MIYPVTKKCEVFDTYFGTEVQDPYRWLEDDNSEETAKWIDSQNKLTNEFLENLNSRDAIKLRLRELMNYKRVGVPFYKAGHWFVFINSGLQNQASLFVMNTLNDEPQLLLDVDNMSDDGTVALVDVDISPDGKYLVCITAASGSDWNEILVIEIANRCMLADRIKWVKFSELSCFENGFFYSAYSEPDSANELTESNLGQKVYFHEYGDSQDSDILVFPNCDLPQRMYTAKVDAKREWLSVSESESTTGNILYFKSLQDTNADFIKINDGFDCNCTFIEAVEGKLLILTNDEAPKYRVVAIDVCHPQKKYWKEIIPECDDTLESCSFCGDRLFANYISNAVSRIKMYMPDGKYAGEVNLPAMCSVDKISGTPGNNNVFYSLSSFATPLSVFRYDIDRGESENFFFPQIKSFDSSDFEVKQEIYTSKDGTEIPLFITSKKGMKKDGNNPTLLYGYGGFEINMMPSFSATNLFFIESGGVYVVANIRGGGEYGKEWHEAGTLFNKQNVFDDFIAAAEYLVGQKYTSPARLAIRGGSNGGLLVGAVTNQRPDLFKVALPAVGVLDMLRYHLFTIGYAWASDYGRSDDSKAMFEYLYKYSPYHNVKSQKYPAIFATTADHDDRVVPSHTFKYISRVQELNIGELPTLIRIDTKAGHGAGKPTSKIIDEYADMFSFLFYFLDMKINNDKQS